MFPPVRSPKTTSETPSSSSPTVVLGITGSIAAYKAVMVARLLLKQGVSVVPVMTESAVQFVGEATLGGLCGGAVYRRMFDPIRGGEQHVSLAEAATVMALVPATADLLTSVANGRASDLLRATLLCARCPLVFAPAMHPSMWSHPAVARAVEQLKSDRNATFVGPVDGLVASGASGVGRMAEPEDIVDAIAAALALASAGAGDLSGRHVLVTAGPTVEDLDPARFLSNRSSGKMGFAVARRAAERGARVTLVAGPVHLGTPRAVTRVNVRTAVEMQNAVSSTLETADVVVMAAAVADYRPKQVSEAKLKRTGNGQERTIELVANPDILAGLGAAREETAGKTPLLVGFALETESDDTLLIEIARGKLRRKCVDMVVANRAAVAFDGETNEGFLVEPNSAIPVPFQSKLGVADTILDWVAARLDDLGKVRHDG